MCFINQRQLYGLKHIAEMSLVMQHLILALRRLNQEDGNYVGSLEEGPSL